MKIFLHIGNYKTGSTAIQSFLFQNRERLRELGYYVPETGRIGDAHHAWAGTFSGRPGSPADPDTLYGDIRAELAVCGCDKAIVSTETLFNGMLPKEVVRRLPGHEIVVVAYLRRQDEFASAFYMQLVKHPNFMEANPPDLSRFLKKQGAIDYLRILRQWAEVVGQQATIVYPYEKSQLPNGLMADFLNRIGIAPDAFPAGTEAPSVNVTIETELIEYLRIANGLGPSQDEHARLLHALTEISRRWRAEGAFHRRNVFSPAQRRELLSVFEDDNREIARQFVGRPEGVLFVDPLPADDPTWTPMALSPEIHARITAALWLGPRQNPAQAPAIGAPARQRPLHRRIGRRLRQSLMSLSRTRR